MPDHGSSSNRAEVAYVLKGFPRLSELFIASEIHRLEQQGVRLRLFVLKPRDEQEHHPVVDRIVARPHYLPATSSLTATSLPAWLATNLRPFLRPLGRCARRRPLGLARAAGAAFAQSVRARRTFWSAPRKLYLKELLYAAALSDQLLAAPRVRHVHAHFAHGATTVTWLASLITGLPFSFTGHAKDVYSESLNPAGLLRRKLLAARFAVTCTDANREHLLRLAPGAVVHRVYHGLNADFSRLMALNPDPPICAGGAPVWTRQAAPRAGAGTTKERVVPAPARCASRVERATQAGSMRDTFHAHPGGPAERPANTQIGGSGLNGTAPSRGDATFRVLAVGRLVEKKGFDLLIDACALLHGRGIETEVVIAGEDGDHADELRRRIARAGLVGRVHLAGAMSQAALFDQYRRASAFCLPCRVLGNGDRDGIPNVLVEAMAAGAPIVTTSISGIPELVDDGVNGLLVAPDDAQALASALELLSRDAELCARLSGAARRTVEERFDGDLLAAGMAELFAEAA